MRVLVTGATGVAGRSAVAALVRAGHHVGAVTRGAAKAEAVRALGATPLEVDLFDAEAARDAVAGHDAVCNLATHIPPLTSAGRPSAWHENDRIRRVVSAHLVDAALAAGTVRLVQESIGFLYPDHGAEWIDEGLAPQPAVATQSALDAEANVARFTAAGRAGVVLRFAQFYGAATHHSRAMVTMARWLGLAPLVGALDGYVSSIHADDIGPAVVAALGARPGIYNVTDDEPLRRRELAAVFAAALGKKRLWTPGRLLAKLGGATSEAVSRSHRLSNAAFRAATGWAPTVRSARDGWPRVIRDVLAG
jgi:nucleoside-diphosphate-sugar epimerase